MYRKFSADYIFTGRDILHGNEVLITDREGTIVDLVEAAEAGDGIEPITGMITPGFINTHCHLELSHLKGVIPEKTGLVPFVEKVMRSRDLSINAGYQELEMHREMKLEAMRNAEAELYLNGTVAVGDVCNTTDSIPVKASSKISWVNFIEVSGFVDAAAEARLAGMLKVAREFSFLPSPARLSPHSPYSVSESLFKLINQQTPHSLLTIHNQESAEEDELFRSKKGHFLDLYQAFGIDISGFQPTGLSSIQSWLPYFTNHQSIISVHNSFLTATDFRFVQQETQRRGTKLTFCLCVNANKYIEDKIPPIGLLKRGQCDLVLGTDSYASNHQLSILEEIKTVQREMGTEIQLAELFQWATLNGAKALQMQHSLGSFKEGKKPGIVVINNLDDGALTPASTSRLLL